MDIKEFENVPLCGSVAKHIKFLVNKRKALMHELDIVCRAKLKYDNTSTTKYDQELNRIWITRNKARQLTIKNLLIDVEDELKSYDHRNEEEAARHIGIRR